MAARSKENFYRRDPMACLNGMMGLSMDEKCVYNVVLDLLYSTWRPLEDNRAFIAPFVGCAVQKLNPIIARLIEKSKLIRFEENGVWYLSNDRFEAERDEVRGKGNFRSGRREVREKSGRSRTEVPTSPPTCPNNDEESQKVVLLEEIREEKKRAPAQEPAPDLNALGWSEATALLTTAGGLSAARAKPVIGRWLREHRLQAADLLGPISDAVGAGTQDPVAYISAILKRGPKKATVGAGNAFCG